MAAPAGARLRRTWPQRLLISFNLLLIMACLAGATGIGYFYYRFGQLPRIAFGPDVLADEPPGQPQNFLLVGSDSRAFVDSSLAEEQFGDSTQTGGQRSDTIIVVRIDPQTKRAAMISFPRDLWIPIAPDGHQQRINTAFTNGPEQLIQTIKLNYQIPINHYIQVDFKGFQGLVDAVGGIELYLPGPVRDKVTQLNMTEGGCVVFHGGDALAYVRSRHFQYQENGRWRSDPRGDLGRIERQQDFIRRALRKALSSGLTDPGKLNGLIDVAIDNVAVDDNLSARDIINLGKQFKSLAPDTLAQYQLPVVNARRNGASVVVVQEKDKARVNEIMDVFRGVPPAESAPVDPSAVKVQVLNGSGRSGEAGQASEALATLGFGTAGPGDGRHTDRTTIVYGPGQLGKAQLLERYLTAGATLQEDSNVQGVDVRLITGTDYTGILAEPRAADASSSTTAPSAPTTTAPPAPDC